MTLHNMGWLGLAVFTSVALGPGELAKIAPEGRIAMGLVASVAVMVIAMIASLSRDPGRDSTAITQERKAEQTGNVYIVLPPAQPDRVTVRHHHTHDHHHVHTLEYSDAYPAAYDAALPPAGERSVVVVVRPVRAALSATDASTANPVRHAVYLPVGTEDEEW